MSVTESGSLSRASRVWAALLVLATVVFSPFYVYASGLPQPAHVVMLVASVALILLNRNACLSIVRANKRGILLILLISLINVTYCVFYQDKGFIFSTIYWVYGYLLLFAVLCIAKDPWLGTWTTRLIIFELFLIAVSYLVGWGHYTWWPRYEYFFNGPNQLAYFVICLLLAYVAVTKGRLEFGLYMAYALTIFIVITTGGRSAYLAMIPFVMLLIWVARKRWVHLIMLVLIPAAIAWVFTPLCLPAYMPVAGVNQRVDCSIDANASEKRVVSDATMTRIDSLSTQKEVEPKYSIKTQLLARGYMRLIEYPQFMLYGAGQGRDERFGDLDGYVYEIHSSPVAVLFYYGFLGLTLFAAFLWQLFTAKRNLLFLTPLFVYGLFTYGLRAPYFWFALGFMAVMPDLLRSSLGRAND
jgi:hypothetical protein